jgi:hypothetical protein
VHLLEPWSELVPGRREQMEAELARELSPEHPLHGEKVTAVAARSDRDDVLFEVAGHGVAVVHLTWSGCPERSPEWPTTRWFASLDDWRERGMRVDRAEYAAP